MQQLGGTLGTALLGTVFLHEVAVRTPEVAAQNAFGVAFGLLVATTAAAVFMTPRRR